MASATNECSGTNRPILTEHAHEFESSVREDAVAVCSSEVWVKLDVVIDVGFSLAGSCDGIADVIDESFASSCSTSK